MFYVLGHIYNSAKMTDLHSLKWALASVEFR